MTDSDSDDDFYALLGKAISQPVKEQNENICLITLEPLEKEMVTLGCGHRFNYMPIFEEFKTQSGKDVAGKAVLRCPYCRTIYNGCLPMIDGVPYNKYIHSPASTMKCEWTFKIGKKKGQMCGADSKMYCQGGHYCSAHYKSAKNKKKVVIQEENEVMIEFIPKKKDTNKEYNLMFEEHTDIMEKPENVVIENEVKTSKKELDKIHKKNIPVVRERIKELIELFEEEELPKFAFIMHSLLEQYLKNDSIYIGDMLIRLSNVMNILFGISSKEVYENLKHVEHIEKEAFFKYKYDFIVDGDVYMKAQGKLEDSIIVPLKKLNKVFNVNIMDDGKMMVSVKLLDYMLKMDMAKIMANAFSV